MSAKSTTRRVRREYAFIKAHRTQEDARLLRLIQASFTASHGVYGAPLAGDVRRAYCTRSRTQSTFGARMGLWWCWLSCT